MKVLVVNDDSYEATGIKILVDALKKYVEVVVYAPSKCESAQGQKITIHKPIKVDKIDTFGVEAYKVDGSTADCVRLGIFNNKDIDLIISGVNQGLNIGQDIHYSSTIAGVIQAGLLGYRGVALSCDKNYDDVINQIDPIIEEYIVNNDKHHNLLNINFPSAKFKTYKGIKETVCGNRYFENEFTYNDGCYLESDIMVDDYTRGTDSGEVAQGYVSVSKLTINKVI
ncbi:MAG: 5'/3'-nucleotidase SurE [bacterium]